MAEPKCRVSFVVTTRNDGFGGGMLDRLDAFVHCLLALANRHGLDGEILIVEWNPPEGPRLHDVLELRETSDRMAIRFLEVPPRIHHSLRNSDEIALFQMIAKNVGIRRARGEFIVATNQDILFSDSLIEYLAHGELDRDEMYRIDRWDVPANVPRTPPIDGLLTWCDANLIRVHRWYGSFDLLGRETDRFAFSDVTRWLEVFAREVRNLHRARRISLEGLRNLLRRLDPRRLLHARSGPLHTNGCGDFTMLSRDRWHALRGYAEFPLFSMHLDSLLCWQAAAAGARQHLLRTPHRIYHIDHAHSWVTMDWREKLETFVRKPWLDLGVLRQVQAEMLSGGGDLTINGADWGFGGETLPEVEIRGGRKYTTAAPRETVEARDEMRANQGR